MLGIADAAVFCDGAGGRLLNGPCIHAGFQKSVCSIAELTDTRAMIPTASRSQQSLSKANV